MTMPSFIEGLSPSALSDLLGDVIDRSNALLRKSNLGNYQCPRDEINQSSFNTMRRALVYLDAVENYLSGKHLTDTHELDALLEDTKTVPSLDAMIALVAVAHNVGTLLPQSLGHEAILDATKYTLGGADRCGSGTLDYNTLDHSNPSEMERAAKCEIANWWSQQVVIEAAITSNCRTPWEWTAQTSKDRRPSVSP
jgi:hypothetical protein